MLPVHDNPRANLVVWAVEPGEDEPVRQAFEHLRYQVFVEQEGFERPNPLYPFRERTREDEYSSYLVAMRGAEVLCGCRLIDGMKGPLPIEQALSGHDVSRAFEISRVCNHPGIRDVAERCRLFRVLYEAMCAQAFYICDYDYLYSHIRVPYLKMLRRFFGPNFFTTLGEPQVYVKNDKSVELIPVQGDDCNLNKMSNILAPMVAGDAEVPRLSLVRAWQTPRKERHKLLLAA